VGDLAEKENHHPDIYLHDYKKVKISLFTHEKQAITALDHSLAKKIDNLLL
jgi:4a-hydroxytetrahydrobiopterin dehydratase